MAITVTVTDPVDIGENTITVYGTLTFTGSYPANGDTISFANLDQIKSTSVPRRMYIQEQPLTSASQLQSGYQYSFNQGTTQANGKIQVLQGGGSGAPSSEISAGAYPTAIKNATVVFEAVFLRV